MLVFFYLKQKKMFISRLKTKTNTQPEKQDQGACTKKQEQGTKAKE
jgi:hypothetical protein